MIGEQEDIRLEVALLLDRVGLGGHVALLDRILVGDERRRVEVVGFDVLVLEAVGGLHPVIERRQPFLADEGGRLGQVVPFVEPDAGMRHHDLRILLEIRRDDDDRQVLLDRVEVDEHVAAHVEIDLAGGQQQAVVGLRAALQDRHVEAVFRVGAVDHRLIIAAVLGLGEPVGAERHLVERERRTRQRQARPDRPRPQNAYFPSPGLEGQPAAAAACKPRAIVDLALAVGKG